MLDGDKIRIIPIEYGKSVLPESLVFSGGKEDKEYAIVFKIYLVYAFEKVILIDAGCETMPGFIMRDFIGTVKALHNINVSPEEITDVIVTHAHHDHIECVGYFKNALIHIQKDEYDCGKEYIPDGFSVNVFDDEFAICENVKVLKIGGHSKGSCIVEIYDKDKCFVVVGDECYSHKCISEQIPTGNSVCMENSVRFIEKYSDSRYNLLFCHDERNA